MNSNHVLDHIIFIDNLRRYLCIYVHTPIVSMVFTSLGYLYFLNYLNDEKRQIY